MAGMADRFFKHIALALGAALVALIVTGCHQRKASRPPCPAGKVCVEFGNSTDPATLDPAKVTLVNEGAIIRELMQGMVSDDAAGGGIPGMAKSWETSPDGLVWTLHMRPALWSDGQPVTADDFVFAYRRILDPKTASSYAYLLYLLKNGEAINDGKAPPEALGAKALDAHTLQLTLEHPAPYLPQLLQHTSYYPVPAHVVRKWGQAWTQPGHYVGNGPYRLVSWRLGDYLRIEKNPLYFDASKVCIDRVDYYPTQDVISAERRVKRGELDLNNSIQSSRLDYLRHGGGMAPYVHNHTWIYSVYLGFNVRGTPALKDIRVRRAIGMSLDRQFITNKLFRAGQAPSTSFVPPGIANYPAPGDARPHAAWAEGPLAARQAEARKLLAEAGYTLKHPLKLTFTASSSSNTLLLVQSIQADLASVGVQVSLLQEDSQVAFQSFEAGDFQIAGLGWIADYNDPLTYLALLKSDTGSQNYGGYANPAYDTLLNQADHEPDAHSRARLLARAEQIALDDAYIVPVYTGVNLNLVSPKITGWVDNDVDVHDVRYLCVRK